MEDDVQEKKTAIMLNHHHHKTQEFVSVLTADAE